MLMTSKVVQKLMHGQQLTGAEKTHLRANGPAIKRGISQYRFDEYENWGMAYDGSSLFVETGFADQVCSADVINQYLLANNWIFGSGAKVDQGACFERLFSVKVESLLHYVQKFIKEKFGDFRVVGLSLFGSYLYGPEEQQPEDLDLIVLLGGTSFSANPISMHLPWMKQRVFAPGAQRLVASGKIGLTILGVETIRPESEDENGKTFSITYWGESVPIFGHLLSRSAPPPPANIPFPYRTLAWAYKEILMYQDDIATAKKGLRRIINGVHIVNFIAAKMGFNLRSNLSCSELTELVISDSRVDDLQQAFFAYSAQLAREVTRIELTLRQQALIKMREEVR